MGALFSDSARDVLRVARLVSIVLVVVACGNAQDSGDNGTGPGPPTQVKAIPGNAQAVVTWLATPNLDKGGSYVVTASPGSASMVVPGASI